MKRKENNTLKDTPAAAADTAETGTYAKAGAGDNGRDLTVLLVEDGKVKPFSPADYTASTLYQVVDSFGVECRLTRPEEPGNLLFEGKKPSKKTIPILVLKDGNSVLLEDWDTLESNPGQLAEVVEVIGATPVKQVFVLKRR
ncbi:MAG: hypothetical protein AB2L11_12935 [Syntrophobacteraceae bacterium]